MKLIKKISWIRALTLCCIKLNTRISIFISIIAYIAFGNKITASKIFVLFSLYDLMKLTVVEFFPLAIMFVLDAYVSVKRIQDFLLLPEIPKLMDEKLKNGRNDIGSNNHSKQEGDIHSTDKKSNMNKNLNNFDNGLIIPYEGDKLKIGKISEESEGMLRLGDGVNNSTNHKEAGLFMENVNAVWRNVNDAGVEKTTVALDKICLKVTTTTFSRTFKF